LQRDHDDIKAAYTQLVRDNHDATVKLQLDRMFGMEIVNLGLSVLCERLERSHAIAIMRAIVAQHDERQAARNAAGKSEST